MTNCTKGDNLGKNTLSTVESEFFDQGHGIRIKKFRVPEEHDDVNFMNDSGDGLD